MSSLVYTESESTVCSLGLTDWTIGLDYIGLTFLSEFYVTKLT